MCVCTHNERLNGGRCFQHILSKKKMGGIMKRPPATNHSFCLLLLLFLFPEDSRERIPAFSRKKETCRPAGSLPNATFVCFPSPISFSPLDTFSTVFNKLLSVFIKSHLSMASQITSSRKDSTTKSKRCWSAVAWQRSPTNRKGNGRSNN